MRPIWLLIFGTSMLSIPGFSQKPAAKPSFEVATIKHNTAVQGRSRLADQPGGRFVATRVTLRTLIAASRGGNMPDGPLLGGPSWLDSDLWDIEAKASEGS